MSIESAADGDVKMDMRALWLAIRRRLLRIIVVTAVLLAATYAALLFVPRSYESTSSILVEDRNSAYTRPANDNSSEPVASSESLDSLVSSQIELVKSRDTLLAVVRTENLTQVPEFNGTASSPFGLLGRIFKKPAAAKAQPEDVAADTLADHLQVTRERDSAVINITVRSIDPALAAKLANAVADADVSRRAGLSLSDTADASQWLEQQIIQLRQRVSDAETKVANFKVDNDLYTGTNSTSLTDQQMADISAQITAAQGRRSTAQSRSALIRGLIAANQPIDGVEDVRNSVTIQQLMQQKAQLTSQKAQLLATLLPSHPSVMAVTAQLAAIDRQITIEGRRVADALDAEAKIEDASIASLEKNLNDLKAKAGDATKQGVTLDSLEREAKADRDLLESYMTRYRDATARTDSNSVLPDLRVVTYAVPSTAPSSPKTALILGAVGFVSLAVQLGAILFGELLSGRALIEQVRRERQADAEPAFTGPVIVTRRYPRVEAKRKEGLLADAQDAEPFGQKTVAEEAPLPGRGDAEADVPIPESVSEAEATEAAPAGRTGGLRRWFARRARAVGATLSSYEPPAVGGAALPPAAGAEAEPRETAADGRSDYEEMRADAVSDDLEEAGGDIQPVDAESLANLSADLILGRSRLVLLAALDGHADSEALADRLIGDVLRRGLSVAKVDAGSARPSTEPGLTDLAAGQAGFGDVVHKRGDDGLAEVPWGHLVAIERRSTRPVTLVEALSDIYEVVIVMTGRIGMASTLPMFAGLSCRLILVATGTPDPARLEAARADIATLGYDSIELIIAPAWHAEVA
jgi:uncharacterized protein involved in exopolysaccharide biosynthesis